VAGAVAGVSAHPVPGQVAQAGKEAPAMNGMVQNVLLPRSLIAALVVEEAVVVIRQTPVISVERMAEQEVSMAEAVAAMPGN
jgi:hypothetical protein